MTRRLIAECLGTLLLALTMGLCLLMGFAVFATALIHAIVLAGLLLIPSPGHFNPAVTLGLVMAGRFSPTELVPMVSAQIIGASLGAGLFLLVAGNPIYLVRQASPSLSTPVDFLVVLVAMWVVGSLVILANHKRISPRFMPLIIGMAFFAAINLSLPLTHFAFNPALVTGLGLIADPGAKSQLWLSWLASLSGAGLGGLSGNYLSAKMD